MADRKEYERQYRANQRAAERDLTIPRVGNARRRRKGGKNSEWFCRTYFPSVFYNPFTADQKSIIKAIGERIAHGGNQAIAAERGGGKTQIFRVVGGIWAMVYGYVSWLVLLGANTSDAEDGVEDIMHHYEYSDLLCEDFPEICIPVRALQGATQRGRTQTAGGERTNFRWSKEKRLTFPMVKGSSAAGNIITPRGVEKTIRGLSFGGMRPDLALGDDLDTDESAGSKLQTDKKIQIIEKALGGSGGVEKPIPIVLLGTIITRNCLIAQYVDKAIKPSYSGIQQKRLKKRPTNMELWDEYVDLRKQDQLDGDPYGRRAHGFYRKNRKQMDAGAVVSNKNRFNGDKLPDKSKMELSALQAIFNVVADKGWEHFNSEFQNEPAETERELQRIEPNEIMSKLNGLDEGVVSGNCVRLTAHIDVHDRDLYFAVVSWTASMTGKIVTYGTRPVLSPQSGSVTREQKAQQTDIAIFNALQALQEEFAEGWSMAETGEVRRLDICLIDAGYKPQVVYQFCRANMMGVYQPAVGRGSARNLKYLDPAKKKGVRYKGDTFYQSCQTTAKVWLWVINADVWKLFIQDGFRVPEADQPKSVSLWGDNLIKHQPFAEQIGSEMWVPEEGRFVAADGTGKIRGNHWLDNMANAAAAAGILGVGAEKREEKTKPKPKPKKRDSGGFLDDLPEL